MVYGYVLLLLVATPYLPSLIRWVSSRWPSEFALHFVLGVEISLGVLLLVLAGAIFIYNRYKFLRFFLIIATSITAASLFYHIIPNPYELTHLPEYGILSILIVQAMKTDEAASSYCSSAQGLRKRSGVSSFYFRSAAVTGTIGAIDELYQGLLPSRSFIWYDILLNGLGGVLGLTIFWGVSRE